MIVSLFCKRYIVLLFALKRVPRADLENSLTRAYRLSGGIFSINLQILSELPSNMYKYEIIKF
jgi:hypothetical protein